MSAYSWSKPVCSVEETLRIQTEFRDRLRTAADEQIGHDLLGLEKGLWAYWNHYSVSFRSLGVANSHLYVRTNWSS